MISTLCGSRLTVASFGIVFGSLLWNGKAADVDFNFDFPEICAGVASQLKLDNATFAFSDYVAAGTNLKFPGVDPSCGASSQLVATDMCRVGLFVSTSSRSGFNMEAWLPRNWTGRFLSTGNGGINGCLSYDDMAYAAWLGFATTGQDNGHDNGQNGTDFLNNEDVVVDFAWRALHQSAVVGKEIVASFYEKEHTKSYYLGCSTGGRQGFKMAQDFPEDFDGIVAGAPAVALNNLTSWSGNFHPIIAAAGPDGYPPPSTWDALDAELLKQCDLIDGAADGILEEPSLCTFKPETLICPPDSSNSSSVCITAKQAATVREILSPLYGVDGALVYPRLQPGPSLLASTYGLYSQSQFLYSDHWYKYAVYNDPNLDTSVITPEQMAYAWNRNAGNSNTWSGDLSAVSKRGAKILHYHGQVDSIISSTISNLYYDHVAQTMNLPPSSLDDFYRFFRISGMSHCMGGPGASVIGNRGESYASLDADENVLMAAVRWVEEGVAPETVTGTAWVNATQALGVDYKRRHCRYPYRNVFKGVGDMKDPESWECVL